MANLSGFGYLEDWCSCCSRGSCCGCSVYVLKRRPFGRKNTDSY
jgi:hypothetical protein